MILKAFVFFLAILFSFDSVAQAAKSNVNRGCRRTLLNYYPTALVARDISFGLEKKLIRKFILETTLAWHCLTGAKDNYQQGGRVNILPKYALLTKSNLEWTMVSDLYYLQYFSRDTWFSQQTLLLFKNQTAPDPLYRTKENKSWSTIGMGLGIGFRYRISRRFSLCCENLLTYSKLIQKQTITQIEYLSSFPYPTPDVPELGTSTRQLSPRFGYRCTLKLSYEFCR